jgi:hypothetical protein
MANAFIDWRRRSLAAVRAEENAIASRYAIEPVRTARPVPEGPKIVAARLFEPPEAEAAE